jgi:uncharacterized protein (TIGR03663 family)
MRIAAGTSSVAEAAPAVSPTIGQRVDDAIGRVRQMEWEDWMPWLIVGLATFLRFFWLDIKPPHFDEGINGWFVDQMVKNGFYRYDPTNYHGPLHFYILFVCQTLLGRNVWAIRLPVVLASIFAVFLTLKFEPFVGRRVSRLAALAMAVSPGFVFYGRYSIHEVWLLVFSMLFILGLFGLWQKGTVNYLWCAGMGITGMILTKETYIIHLGCAAIAVVVTWISHKITRMPDAKPVRQTWTYLDLLVLSITAIAAIIFFYSGTFLNWPGVTGLWKTFDAWFRTGGQGNGHEKDAYNWIWEKHSWVRVNYYWIALLTRYEQPVLLALLLCPFCQLFRHVGLRYLAIYGVGTLIAYSIVRYKTPWCLISIAWPLLFVFGAMLTLVSERFQRWTYLVAGAFLAVSLALCVRLNYFRCTTPTEPYVYVQTYNDIWKLTKPLLRLAKANPTYYQLVGHLIRSSTYPLPWMLGDFTKVGYYENNNMPGKPDGDFLLVQQDKIEEVESKLHETYFTEPMTLRDAQDPSKLYFNARVFSKLYPGRIPEFVGKPAPQPTPQPTPPK